MAGKHAVVWALLVAACGSWTEEPNAPRVEIAPLQARPVAPADVVEAWALPAAMIPMGIAVEPDTGRRVVLEVEGRVSELETGEELAFFEAPLPGTGFGDVAALGGGLLALTAVSDGYIASLADGSLVPHFCYEPGWFDDASNAVQASGALAFDALHDRLFAQPLTLANGGRGNVLESFFATYDITSGVDLQWWRTPTLVASGLAVLDAGETPDATTLLVAQGDELLRFDVAQRMLTVLVSFGELGLVSIAGIARDDVAGTLLVLGYDEGADAPAVLEVPLDAVLQGS
ncbi:MAG: hypothetical protein AAF447_00150 [Myxococcota bacterium]